MDDEQKKTRMLGLIKIAYEMGRSDQLEKNYPDVGFGFDKNWESRKNNFWKQIEGMFKER